MCPPSSYRDAPPSDGEWGFSVASSSLRVGVGAALLGKRALAQRLCGSLQLDINKTRQLLDWTPPVSVDEGLRRAAEGFGQ